MGEQAMLDTDPAAAVFAAMPGPARACALRLRGLIHEVAAEMELTLQETLKWGEPAYLPGRAGTTLRLNHDATSGQCRLLVHCQTRLVEEWRARFDGRLRFEGNRAVLIDPTAEFEESALRACILDALTYHARRRRQGRAIARGVDHG
ncbi:MAG: DUF1801 domain-containing protein [Pseudomonadota bacterium]